MQNVQCKCNVGEHGIMPVYMTKGAACADVSLPEDVSIFPGEVRKVSLEISFEIPDDMKIMMYPRSSLLTKYGLMSPTSIIDADYSGQIVHWPVINLGKEAVHLPKGTRIAQIECCPRYNCTDWEHKEADRTGGFGSTGK